MENRVEMRKKALGTFSEDKTRENSQMMRKYQDIR